MLVLSGGRDIYFKEIVFEGAYDKFASHFFVEGLLIIMFLRKLIKF